MHVRPNLGVRGFKPPTGVVRRCQARNLPALGPVLGAGVGAPGGRHPATAQGARSRRDVAGQPLRRVVPQHQPDRRQPDLAPPARHLRPRRDLRRLRRGIRRGHRDRRHDRHRRDVPGRRGGLRCAHRQAPRGVLPVAHGVTAPAQGSLSRQAGHRRGPALRGARRRDADGPVLLRRLRLALQRCAAAEPGRQLPGGSAHAGLRADIPPPTCTT